MVNLSDCLKGGNTLFRLKPEFICVSDIMAHDLKRLGIKYTSNQYHYNWEFTIKRIDLPKLKGLVSEEKLKYWGVV